MRAAARWLAVLLMAAQTAGCAKTVQDLEGKGVEFKRGKVLRVFRF